MRVLLQNIFIRSVFPLEYSRVTFSLLVSGEMNFDKGVAVIVLSKVTRHENTYNPHTALSHGLGFDPVINTKYDLGKLHPNTLW